MTQRPAEEAQTGPRRVRGMRRFVVAGLALVVAGAGIAAVALSPRAPELDPRDPGKTLERVEAIVQVKYPVAEVTAGALAARIAAGRVVLFDVRTRDEFERGHIPGAVRIEPGTDAEAVLLEHGDLLSVGAVAVFYCAVGVRSGRMVHRLARSGAPHEMYNLRGGIFRWFADGRAVVIDGAPADTIHPFDEDWRLLLDRTIRRSV